MAEAGDELGVREIARRLNIASSIAQRYVSTLAEWGFVEQVDDNQKYRIGYRAFQVGQSYVARTRLQEVSLPELRRMAEKEQINAYLGVLRDSSVIYLEALQSKGPIAITSMPGTRGALHSTACGKALLADLSDEEVAAHLGPEPYERKTASTKTTFKQVIQDIRRVRRVGYASSDGENLPSVFAIGVGVRDSSGRVVAAISGALPRIDLHERDHERLRDAVLAAAQRVSLRLGAPIASPSAERKRQHAG
jgi:DNA-binding IclR family transcriptional regulator